VSRVDRVQNDTSLPDLTELVAIELLLLLFSTEGLTRTCAAGVEELGFLEFRNPLLKFQRRVRLSKS